MAEHDFSTLMAALDNPLIVVTTADERERAGCLVEFHGQSSIDPQRYCVWLSKANYTYRVALHSSHLVIHFLTEDDLPLAELFGSQTGDTVDKFAGLAVDSGPRRRADSPAVPPLAHGTPRRTTRRGRRPRLPDHRAGRRADGRAVPAAAGVPGQPPEGGSRSPGTARAAHGTSRTRLTAGRPERLAHRRARPLPGAHGSGRLFSGTLIAERSQRSASGSSSNRGMTCRWGCRTPPWFQPSR